MAKKKKAIPPGLDPEATTPAQEASYVEQLLAGLKKSGVTPENTPQLATLVEQWKTKKLTALQLLEAVANQTLSASGSREDGRPLGEASRGAPADNDTHLSGSAGDEGFSRIAYTSSSSSDARDPAEVVAELESPTVESKLTPEHLAAKEATMQKVAIRLGSYFDPKKPRQIDPDKILPILEGMLPRLSGDDQAKVRQSIANLRQYEASLGGLQPTIIPDEALDSLLPAFPVGNRKASGNIGTALRATIGALQEKTAPTNQPQLSAKDLLRLKKEQVDAESTLQNQADVEDRIRSERAREDAALSAKEKMADSYAQARGRREAIPPSEGIPVGKTPAPKPGLSIIPFEKWKGEDPLKARISPSLPQDFPEFKDVRGKTPTPPEAGGVMGFLKGLLKNEKDSLVGAVERPGIGTIGNAIGGTFTGGFLASKLMGGIGEMALSAMHPQQPTPIAALINRARLEASQRASASQALSQNPKLMAALQKQLQGQEMLRTGKVPGDIQIGGNPAVGPFDDPQGLLDLMGQ